MEGGVIVDLMSCFMNEIMDLMSCTYLGGVSNVSF